MIKHIPCEVYVPVRLDQLEVGAPFDMLRTGEDVRRSQEETHRRQMWTSAPHEKFLIAKGVDNEDRYDVSLECR